MDLKEYEKEALRIRELYNNFEEKEYGKSWSTEDIFAGFVTDIGDLSKLILAKKGMRKVENLDEKISHEIIDCLWSVLVLANKYDVDIEKEFFKNMKKLENRINDKISPSHS